MVQRRQRNSPPTIREVANRAGVSPATVSRVLNNYPHIRPEVRQTVLAAITQLGYEPNRVAQRLRAARSRLIGIVVTDITNPFFNIIMSSIEEVFFNQGFSVLMSNTAADPQKELDYLSMMENEDVAGLIIAPTSENVKRISELADSGLPLTVIDRKMTSGRLDMVLADNVAGAQLAIDHLVQLGHQEIGHVGGPKRLTSGRERFEGYQQAMKSHGLAINPKWVRLSDHRHEGGYAATVEIIDQEPRPTALFVSNNMMTLGALTAIHERGIRVPEDIAIVGFDDMPWSISLNPPLTVVAQPTLEIGYRAANLLLERIADPELPARVEILSTSLVVRASCGANHGRNTEDPKSD